MTTGEGRATRLRVVAAAAVLAPVLALVGWSAFGATPGNLPGELVSAVSNTLAAPSVHIEGRDQGGSTVDEDFQSPDRSRWIQGSLLGFGDAPPTLHFLLVGDRMYVSNSDHPGRYVSCARFESLLRPPPRAAYFPPNLANLSVVPVWGTFVRSTPASHRARRYVLGLGRAPSEYGPAHATLSIVVRGGRVVELEAGGRSRLRVRFAYRPVHVHAPPRRLVQDTPSCTLGSGGLTGREPIVITVPTTVVAPTTTAPPPGS